MRNSFYLSFRVGSRGSREVEAESWFHAIVFFMVPARKAR